MAMTYNSAPILMFFLLVLYRIVQCIWGGEEEEDDSDQLTEGLDEYYNALKTEDKAIIRGQEEYYKKNFGIATYSDEQYGKLRNAGLADDDHIIMGCATYRLLDSLTYVQAFQYEAPKLQNDGSTKRDEVIFITTDEDEKKKIEEKEPDYKQGDATYLAVYFPYLATEKQKRINFDTSEGKELFL